MYPGKGNLLQEKWPLMSACVLEFAGHVFKDWKTRFHVEGKKDSDFTAGMIAFTVWATKNCAVLKSCIF